MKPAVRSSVLVWAVAAAAVVVGQSVARAGNLFTDDFESNPTNNVVPAGWTSIANWTKGATATGTSKPNSFTTTGIGAGHPFYGHNIDAAGNNGRFIAATGNGPSPSDIDLWTLSPSIAFNGSAAQVSFWTFSMGSSTAYLEVRAAAGAGATVPNNAGNEDNALPAPLTGGVGDFSNLLLTVNPTRAEGGFPTYTAPPDFAPQWTQYTATIPAGLIPADGRIAFRSWGTNQFGQPTTYRIVAIDDVSVDAIVIPDIQWAHANGNWSAAASWTGGSVPNGSGAVATLGNNGGLITSARVVTNDAPHTVSKLTFDLNAGYTIAGTAPLTIAPAAGPGVVVVQGSHTITAPLTLGANATFDIAGGANLSVSGTLGGAGKTLTKIGAGTLALSPATLGGLAIDAGSVKLGSAANTTVGTLNVASGATLELNGGSLVVDYDGGSPLANVKAALAGGQITAGSLTAGTGIGYVDTAVLTSTTSHRGAFVDNSSVIVAKTLLGDTNLDFTVNFADLLALAKRYNQAGQWWQGDFSGNGTVGFEDLLSLAKNYNRSAGSALDAAQTSAAFEADWNLAQSLVPEPTSALSLAATALLPIARRTRRR